MDLGWIWDGNAKNLESLVLLMFIFLFSSQYFQLLGKIAHQNLGENLESRVVDWDSFLIFWDGIASLLINNYYFYVSLVSLLRIILGINRFKLYAPRFRK